MRGMMSVWIALWIVVAPAGGADYEPNTPSTYLFDTGATSPTTLPGTRLDPTSGWTLVPEDNVAHKFQGDAVARNDRLILVLRAKGAGAELYGLSPAGAKLRAVLAPTAASGGRSAALAGLRIVENGPAAVMLAATFTAADGTTCALTYRLTAGQMLVEVRPGQRTSRLMVDGQARYVVVPDFFGDDMVFRTEDMSRPRLRLPAENFFLQMMDEGNSLVMCVWQSGAQGAAATGSGCEIDAAQDKSIWIACLEGAGLWHEFTQAKRVTPEGWKPPFPAKWRVDRLGDGGSALAYAMDRSLETPLMTFCPIDVLRNTLGVGPCQYILQTEGLGAETSPTPDSVMTWVEKQFSRKKQKKAADEIRELLDQMVRHVGHAQARIDQYGRFAREAAQLCKAAGESPAAKSLGQTAARLEQAVAAAASTPAPAERAARIASEVVDLVNQEGALADCEKLGAQARSIGAVQDRTLANCRMMVRWLKQSAAMLVEDDPRGAKLAAEVYARAERLLQPQTPPYD